MNNYDDHGAVQAELEQDAARYRWLRDRAGNSIMNKLMDESRPEKWNELVDRDRGASTVGDGHAG